MKFIAFVIGQLLTAQYRGNLAIRYISNFKKFSHVRQQTQWPKINKIISDSGNATCFLVPGETWATPPAVKKLPITTAAKASSTSWHGTADVQEKHTTNHTYTSWRLQRPVPGTFC